MTSISGGAFIARPIELDDLRVLIPRAIAHNAFFSDTMTSDPNTRAAALLRDLVASDSLSWAVVGPLGLCGILRLTGVRLGEDATAHAYFIDGRVTGKTKLLLAWRDWIFSELGLPRVSVEVPEHMYGLRKFAARLGCVVEGRKRAARRIGGASVDLILMGCLRSEVDSNELW